MVNVKKPVLCSYPQISLVVTHHAVVFRGIAFNLGSRRERYNGIGLSIEHENTILGIYNNPPSVYGAGTYEIPVSIEFRQFCIQRRELVSFRIEIPQCREGVAQNVAPIIGLLDEGHAIVG